MSPALYLTLIGRELRRASGRITAFVASIAIGVAAVVLVAGLADSVSRAIRLEGRPLLGGDVAVRSSQPLPASLDAAADAFPDLPRADTVELLTMAASPPGADGTPGQSLLVELKAVGPGWPFYGGPTLDPDQPLQDLLGSESAIVEPALLERLGLRVTETIRVGQATFTLRAVITKDPGRLPSGLGGGPRVLISLDGLKRAGLGESGARITRRALFRAPDEARAEALVAWVSDHVPESTWLRVETWTEAQPSAQRSVARTERFLGLVALLALLVGGVGVARTTQAWLASRMDALAVQRALGLTPGEIGRVYLGAVLLLGLVGSALGAGLGTAVLALVPRLLDGVLPPEAVAPFQPAAIAWGICLGVGVAALFSLGPLARVRAVPPLRVLRRDAEPLPEPWPRRVLQALVLGLGIFLVSLAQARDALVAGAFAGGVAAVVGAGAGAAVVLGRVMAAVAPRARVWWLRHGLLAPSRPGAGTGAAMVALAVGVLVVLSTVLIQGRLNAQISSEFPERAPSVFLLDVQPDQATGVQDALTQAGASLVRTAPMVMGRLLEVRGVPVEQLAADRSEDDRWALTREQRLSYMAELPADNVVLAGGPFSDPAHNELSLEERYAASLGVGVGDTLTFDVQGVPIPFVVSSLRSVAWESFNMNFFLVAEPGVLDGAPQSILVTAQLPAAVEPAVQDQLAARYPNVTLISVRAALVQAQGLLTKLGWGVRLVGGFSAVAGVIILVSAVVAAAGRRNREVALLKTLGVTRAGVAALFAVEYALVGAVAGVVGALGAAATSYGVVTGWMTLRWAWDLPAMAGAVLACVVLFVVAGVLGNRAALRAPPMAVLRGE